MGTKMQTARRTPTFLVAAFAAGAALACQPVTTRPAFAPLPEAAATEVRLGPADATRRLAEALRNDSIPVSRLEQRDGYLESEWFEGATGRPTDRAPLGPDVVRVRAWAERARPYSSVLIVETVYRPLSDPSRAERELERPVAEDHPVAVKVRATLDSLVKRYGGAPGATSPGAKAGAPVAPTPPAPATPRTP